MSDFTTAHSNEFSSLFNYSLESESRGFDTEDLENIQEWNAKGRKRKSVVMEGSADACDSPALCQVPRSSSVSAMKSSEEIESLLQDDDGDDPLWSPTLSKAFRERDSKGRKRTPRTLTRLMQQHRENERHRHHGLNATIKEISRRIPGFDEACRETKIVKLHRIINYICHLEEHIQGLCDELGIDLDFKNLFLSPHMSNNTFTESKKGSPQRQSMPSATLSNLNKLMALKNDQAASMAPRTPKQSSRTSGSSTPSLKTTSSTYSFQNTPCTSRTPSISPAPSGRNVMSSPITPHARHHRKGEPVTSSAYSVASTISCSDSYTSSMYPSSVISESSVDSSDDQPQPPNWSHSPSHIINNGGSTEDLLGCSPLEPSPTSGFLSSEDCDHMLTALDLQYLEKVLEGDNVWDFLQLTADDDNEDEGDATYTAVDTAPFCRYSSPTNDTAAATGSVSGCHIQQSDPQLVPTCSPRPEHPICVYDAQVPQMTSPLLPVLPLSQSPTYGFTPKSPKTPTCHVRGSEGLCTPPNYIKQGLLKSPTSTLDHINPGEVFNLDGLSVIPPYSPQPIHHTPPVRKSSRRPKIPKRSPFYSSLANVLRQASNSPAHSDQGDFSDEDPYDWNQQEGSTSTGHAAGIAANSVVWDSDQENADPLRDAEDGCKTSKRRVDQRKMSWMNGFMMYSRIHRRRYIHDNPGERTSQISRMMGQDWKKLSEEERKPYIEKAEVYRQYHLLPQMPHQQPTQPNGNHDARESTKHHGQNSTQQADISMLKVENPEQTSHNAEDITQVPDESNPPGAENLTPKAERSSQQSGAEVRPKVEEKIPGLDSMDTEGDIIVNEVHFEQPETTFLGDAIMYVPMDQILNMDVLTQSSENSQTNE